MKGANCEYESLNPWSEADQPPLKGLSPRIKDLDGKTIGLLINTKLAARPLLTAIEWKLKERYPTLKTRWYEGGGYITWHQQMGREQDTVNPRLQEWVKGVDAVITAIGD